MGASGRRGMSWPTAWSALLPVYGLALTLHAFFPLFSVPVWAIYVFYGFRVLDAARATAVPWEAGVGPRRYLLLFLPLIVINFLAFTVGLMESSAGAVLLFDATLVLAYGSAALFTAGSAPTVVRNELSPVRAGIVAALLSAIAAPEFAGLLVPISATASLALGFASVVLAVLSWLAFTLAERASRRAVPLTARRAPKA